MKARRRMLMLLAAVLIATLLLMACASRGKQAPGLIDGKLAPCPGTPNCVSSESDVEASRVEPLRFSGEPETAWSNIKLAVTSQGGTIRQDDGTYLWATYTSKLFRFVDDVELRLDAANQHIHVRSASRVGYSDLGVNRKRVETLRKAFPAQ